MLYLQRIIRLTNMEDFEFSDNEAEEVINIEYDITSYPSDYTLMGLVEMFKNGDIMIPDYQRGYVWNIKQASLLIESFLIGLPVPPIFLYIDDENKNLVIDGQQRLLSIVYFFEGYFGKESLTGKRQVFKLSGLNSKNKFYNCTYNDLDDKDKRKLASSVLRAINIRQLSPTKENTSVYHIFERLNTGGTPLKPQEIRNCVFRSDFLNKLKELNKNPSWRKVINKKDFVKNQSDIELILRVYGLAYYLSRYEKPMKEFLNKVAKSNMNACENIDSFAIAFERTAGYINSELRSKPFHVRGPFNVSLFDSVFCKILLHVDNLPANLPQRYEELLVDQKFTDLTTLATTDEKILKERFEYVETFLFNDGLHR